MNLNSIRLDQLSEEQREWLNKLAEIDSQFPIGGSLETAVRIIGDLSWKLKSANDAYEDARWIS